MSTVNSVIVDLSDRTYEIHISNGLLERVTENETFSRLKHAVIVADSTVAGLYLKTLQEQLTQMGVRNDAIIFPAGETAKCVSQLDVIWNDLLSCQTDRRSTIVALGGGVAGDLAGFAAASFARGIEFIQIPTTLLAQVDSSVGGKTGINLPGSKNMVGAFWQPRYVLIDPSVLRTLDDSNFRAGIAEVIKYGMIMDEAFVQYLSEHADLILAQDTAVLSTVIAKCCQLKAQIVQEDETETSGRRAILNYGHTFGHAIENVFGYGKYLHGEAIAIGMHCAAKLAKTLGYVDQSFVDQQAELIQRFGLPLKIEDIGRRQELVAAMHRDKKVVGGVLKLILPKKIGWVEHCDAPDDDVLMAAF